MKNLLDVTDINVGNIIRLLYYLIIKMTKEEKKSELEQISDFMDYMVYTVFTKDNIELECVLRREQESVSPIFRWEGTVNWVMSKPRGDFCGSKHTLWLTDKGDLEFCISQMNDYIKDNFKTKLG